MWLKVEKDAKRCKKAIIELKATKFHKLSNKVLGKSCFAAEKLSKSMQLPHSQ